MERAHGRWGRRACVIIGLLLATTGITVLLYDALSPLWGMVYLLTVLLCATSAGFEGGLVAAGMATLLVEGLFMPGPPHWWRTAAYFLTGICLSGFADLLRRSRARALAHATEAGEAARRVRESEERFRRMADSAPALIWVADQTKAVTYVNRAWTEFTGRTLEQELGWGWADRVHPDDAGRCLTSYTTAFEARQPFQLLYRLQRADGEWRTIHDHGVPRLSGDGTFLGYIGSCLDITERERASERLRESEKLEAVGRLAGGVAHDFNNLLTAILANAQLMLAAPVARQEQDVLDLTEIINGAIRAGELTRQLLTFSRRDMAHAGLVSVNHAITELAPMLRRLIGEDIRLRIDLNSGAGSVWADKSHLDQIVMNLALNARDAMPRGGTVEITTARKFVVNPDGGLPLPDGPYVQLVVQDDGDGMDAETAKHIFEPFFTTKPGQGTGLGLATVYGIVKQAKGSINVDSTPGHGTRFTVYLPEMAQADAAETDLNVSSPPPRGEGRLLVVEDEPMVRSILSRALQDWGYSVVSVSNGIDAVERLIADDYAYSAVLTDIVMPEMNGRDLGEYIKKHRPDLPVVYMSGYSDSDAFGRRGVPVEYIQKPFDFETLVRRIQSAMSKT